MKYRNQAKPRVSPLAYTALPAHDPGRDPDYLILRELLEVAEADPALAAVLSRLIDNLAPMGDFRELQNEERPAEASRLNNRN